MASMTAKQVASLAKSGEPTRKSDGKGLYFVVPDSGSSYWAFRYSGNGKRKQMTLGQYPDMSLADARSEAEVFKRDHYSIQRIYQWVVQSKTPTNSR